LSTTPVINHFPRAQADRCVMCGLCLPHCPTYRVTGDENASPRGRIALMRALAQGDLPLSPRLEGHLAGCTACRACENVCPSYVGYGEVYFATRAALARAHPLSRARRRVRDLLIEHGLAAGFLRRTLIALLRAYQMSGVQRLARASGGLRWLGLARIEALLPRIARYRPLPRRTAATGAPGGRVALFTGCVASVVDNDTLQAAIKVLTHLGYEVVVPRDQACCGALHLHAGDPERARRLMHRNLAAFDDPGVEAIVGVASGCTSTLVDYARHVGDDPRAAEFARKAQDIHAFLAQRPWPAQVTLRPQAETIALHEPCSLRHVLHAERHPAALLGRIPGLRVVPLSSNRWCCGGAGSYMLEQPAMAERLRADKIEELRALAPARLATCNLGCALHLAAGLRAAGLAMETVHPITLLARQLPD
jgi:glycolate oxidase iron-sulfur subunit